MVIGMPRGIQSIVAGCAFALASQTMSIAHSESDSFPDAFDPCRHHLRTLVAYLRETEQLEDQPFSVEWRQDCSVVIRCRDFSQYMWCDDGELHIRFGDPISGE